MKNIDIARLTPETWPARREALVKLFGQEEYGVVPAGWTSSFVWEKELEKDGLHGRLGCVTVEYKGRSMSFPFALWLPEKTSEPVPCAIQISCHDPVVHDQMKGIDPAMREKFMGMMKELVGNEDHFNVMMIDMMAPEGTKHTGYHLRCGKRLLAGASAAGRRLCYCCYLCIQFGSR